MSNSVWQRLLLLTAALVERASVWDYVEGTPVPPPPPPSGAFVYDGAENFDGTQTYDGTL